MTNCTPAKIEFPACKNRKVEAAFSGGDIASDGGSLLLWQADRRLSLLSAGYFAVEGRVKNGALPGFEGKGVRSPLDYKLPGV